MARLEVVDVFVGSRGGGNRLGVFVEPDFGASAYQDVAAELGYSETVFVADARRGELRIFTPAVELPLAGHPLVGTAHVLAARGFDGVLRPPAGEVATRCDGDSALVRVRPEWAPPFERLELATPADVDAWSVDDVAPDRCLQVWAWLDEPAGRIRTRVFPRGYGIDEDEATGAAAILLCDELRRELTLEQGTGSLLRVRPVAELIELGGAVRQVETREHPPPKQG